MKTLVIAVLVLLSTEALGQVVIVQPDPLAGFYDTLRRNRENQENTGRQMGSLLVRALHKKQTTSVVLVIKCEHYVSALVTYDDGTLNNLNLIADGNEVDRTELAAYQAALPALQVVDGGCQ